MPYPDVFRPYRAMLRSCCKGTYYLLIIIQKKQAGSENTNK